MMKKLYICVALLCSGMVVAQNPLLDSMPYVHIYQDSAVTRLLNDKITGAQREQVLVDGYRVQIYSSNVQQKGKNEAIELEHRLTNQIDKPIYVTYISPSWKVRIGDFVTYEEAQAYKNELVQQFPELQASSYVIGDQILVLQ